MNMLIIAPSHREEALLVRQLIECLLKQPRTVGKPANSLLSERKKLVVGYHSRITFQDGLEPLDTFRRNNPQAFPWDRGYDIR